MFNRMKADKNDEANPVPAPEPTQPSVFDDMVGGEIPADVDTTAISTEFETAGPLEIYTNQPDFHPEDITPPVIKLLQALSPDVIEGSGRAGQWVLSGFDPQPVMNVVPISFARRREYREEDSPVISCISYDGENGEGDPGGVCADCPMNKWTGEGKSRHGPLCMFMYSYMVYVKEYDTVAVINFKKTGLSVGRALNSIVARSGMGNVAVVMSAKLQQGGKGSYYVPVVQPIPASAAMEVLQSAKAFLGG